jgi:hypothetical protein
MAKTHIQRQRPIAKGRHQKPNTRWSTRENPPRGVNWGGKLWPGTGAGTVTPVATWLFDVATAAAGILAGEVRVNNTAPTLVTHVFVSKTVSSGTDPTATWTVNDPLRIYYRDDVSMWVEYKITAVSSQTGYFDYTVTYTGYSGNYATPPDATPVTLIERTTVPGADPAAYDPGEHTVDEVKAHVNELANDDQRDNIIQAILDKERLGQNRSTLVSWLDQQTGVE